MRTAADGDGYLNANTTEPITTCGDGSLCCGSLQGSAGQDCCNQRQGLFLQDGKLISASITATSTPTVAAATTASTTSAQASKSSSSTSPAPKQASDNTGEIAGGVVGGIAGITILALGFWYFMIRRSLRQRSQQERCYGSYAAGKGQTWQEPSEAPTYEKRGNELEATEPRTQELYVDSTVPELR